jgi:iron(III) transport system substrate-binding protein
MARLRRLFGLASILGALMASGAAHAQKKLVVYTSNESTLNDLVFGAFTKESGITVEPVSAGSGVVMRRLQAEKARPLADIVWGVSRSLLQTNKALFQPYASKNKDVTPAEYRDPNDLWIGNNLHLLVILRNTKLVSDADAPKGWADLLASKWKGKIAFTDPANSGSAYATVTMLVDMWGGGDAGWKKVGELFRNLKATANIRWASRSSMPGRCGRLAARRSR